MNNDLISRERLKNTILLGNYDTQSKILSAIDNAPTVERPQGEWKYHKGDRLFLPYMECSNCKVQDLLGKLTKKEYREVNHFCFNCGAKMKGGKE